MENKKEKNFEESLENLEKIVKALENGDVPLDEAIEKFNEGMKYASVCNEILENATKTVTKALDKDGNLKDFEVSTIEE